jgi:iron(III) transport system permease protein
VLFGAALPIGFLLAKSSQRGLLSSSTPRCCVISPMRSAGGACSGLVVALGFGIIAAKRLGREAWLAAARPDRLARLCRARHGAGARPAGAISLRSTTGSPMRMAAWFGVNPGLVLIGSGAALVIAYVVRFLAIAISGIDSGLTRVSPRIDDAARMLGAGEPEVLRRIHWPLIRPAIAAAALLVFVDCLKELPATLLLRPLNLDTLATMVYGHASRGSFEDGALAALLIVLAGLYPAIILARAAGRPG